MQSVSDVFESRRVYVLTHFLTCILWEQIPKCTMVFFKCFILLLLIELFQRIHYRHHLCSVVALACQKLFETEAHGMVTVLDVVICR